MLSCSTAAIIIFNCEIAGNKWRRCHQAIFAPSVFLFLSNFLTFYIQNKIISVFRARLLCNVNVFGSILPMQLQMRTERRPATIAIHRMPTNKQQTNIQQNTTINEITTKCIKKICRPSPIGCNALLSLNKIQNNHLLWLPLLLSSFVISCILPRQTNVDIV